MYTYIEKKVKFVELEDKLDENFKIGASYNSYLNGCFVLLNDEQVKFHKDHPEASPKEVYYTYLTPEVVPHVNTLFEEQILKVKELKQYDLSFHVNNFKINGEDAWLDKATRVGLMNAINIEKSSGVTNIDLWLNRKCFNIPCDNAIKMLSQLEKYALACYNNTATHENNIMNLTSIESVKNYDFTVGYPQQLSFTINIKTV